VVCRAIELDTSTASSRYIQLYQGDKGVLVSSLRRIQKTASKILTAILPSPEGSHVAA
jgi:hypothetical protein